MDCPHCAQILEETAGRKKHEIIPIQRKYQGGVNTRLYGDTRSQGDIGRGMAAPVGAMLVDTCKSCGWASVWRYDGPSIQVKKGKVTTWRLIECGRGVNIAAHLNQYGYK